MPTWCGQSAYPLNAKPSQVLVGRRALSRFSRYSFKPCGVYGELQGGESYSFWFSTSSKGSLRAPDGKRRDPIST